MWILQCLLEALPLWHILAPRSYIPCHSYLTHLPTSQQGLLTWRVAALIGPLEVLLTWEIAERAFSCLWAYFWVKHGQVLLWDCQVPLTQWVSYIFEVSALQWDFAEFDMLVLQRKNLGTSRRECGKKAWQESLRDELVGVSALTPDPVLIHLRSPKGAVGK